MKIGEVSAVLDIPASSIRYYERVGLLSAPERVSGQRSFGSSDISMLRFIKLAQAAGFSIAEIKDLCVEHSRNPTPSGVWAKFAKEKQQEVREQIEALAQVQTILSSLLACKCESFIDCVEAADKHRPFNRSTAD